MTEPDRERKRALKRRFKDDELAEAEARLPLSKADLAALFVYLDEQLADGCEHTLVYTEAFLAERGLEVDVVLRWLEEYGGSCDCEVLSNVQDKWADHL